MAPPAAKGMPVDCTGSLKACCTDVHAVPDHDRNSRMGSAFGLTCETTTVGGRPAPIDAMSTDAAPHDGSVRAVIGATQPDAERRVAVTTHGTPTARGDSQAARTLPDVSAADTSDVAGGVLVPSVSRAPQDVALPWADTMLDPLTQTARVVPAPSRTTLAATVAAASSRTVAGVQLVASRGKPRAVRAPVPAPKYGATCQMADTPLSSDARARLCSTMPGWSPSDVAGPQEPPLNRAAPTRTWVSAEVAHTATTSSAGPTDNRSCGPLGSSGAVPTRAGLDHDLPSNRDAITLVADLAETDHRAVTLPCESTACARLAGAPTDFGLDQIVVGAVQGPDAAGDMSGDAAGDMSGDMAGDVCGC